MSVNMNLGDNDWMTDVDGKRCYCCTPFIFVHGNTVIVETKIGDTAGWKSKQIQFTLQTWNEIEVSQYEEDNKVVSNSLDGPSPRLISIQLAP